MKHSVIHAPISDRDDLTGIRSDRTEWLPFLV